MHIIFILIMTLLVICYTLYHIWRLIPSKKVSILLFTVFAAIEIVSFFIIRIQGTQLPFSVITLLYNALPVWFYVFSCLSIVFLFFDILCLLRIALVKKYIYKSWTGVIILTCFIIVIASIGYFRYTKKKRVELSINTGKSRHTDLPMKIIAISDLNIGYGIGYKELQQWVQLINKEEPDIVLIIGDIIDHGGIHSLFIDSISPVFRQLKTKFGVYAAMGNQDYMADRFVDPLALNKLLKNSRITMLKDSVALIDELLYVVGRRDYLDKNRSSLKELIAPLDKSKPIILLDHQPFILEKAEENNIDLQISGQTNWGNVFPFTFITHGMYEIVHGYLKKGNTHYYISSGIGVNGGKFRINTQSEYIVINLQ